MKISCKSTPENYLKEMIGKKPNTVRCLDGEDTIEIKNTETGETFTRKIKDITTWKSLIIISWSEEEDVKVCKIEQKPSIMEALLHRQIPPAMALGTSKKKHILPQITKKETENQKEKKQTFSEAELKEMQELRDKGLKLKEIAKRFKVCNSTICINTKKPAKMKKEKAKKEKTRKEAETTKPYPEEKELHEEEPVPEHKPNVRDPSIDKYTERDVLDMRKRGFTRADIAEKMGIPEAKVKEILIRHNPSEEFKMR